MPGQIRSIIDRIITERARGNPTVASTTKTKLILKGINPDRYTASSPDDPAILVRLRAAAAELGVQV